ncbi:MAG TPA: hypothetical protein VGN32_17030, partial [Ktedonobacterales bacterium]|nr:hypothetical protein [Ktedonobacterales bacterium]
VPLTGALGAIMDRAPGGRVAVATVIAGALLTLLGWTALLSQGSALGPFYLPPVLALGVAETPRCNAGKQSSSEFVSEAIGYATDSREVGLDGHDNRTAATQRGTGRADVGRDRCLPIGRGLAGGATRREC